MSHSISSIAAAGRRGSDVRSDCWVAIKQTPAGGIDLRLKSKVASLYGVAIRQLVADMMAAFAIENAEIEMEDAGALPFVLMARIEAAARQLVDPSGTGFLPAEGYLPDFVPNAQYETARDRFRRSRLYLPGNTPKFMLNAGLHRPDGVILDLEDSVAPSAKDEARVLVRNALRSLDFYGAERMVRINQGDRGIGDLDFIIPHNVHVMLIPKVESADQVRHVDRRIGEIQATLIAAGRTSGRAAGIMKSPRGHTSMSGTPGGTESARAEARGSSTSSSNREVFLMPIVESALGVIHAYEIATASPNVVALTIGLEDYTADIGTERTIEGRESLWARSQVINAARAAGVQPIDSVFSDVSDMEALRSSALEAKSLGFEGKGCIHPRQITVVHEAFAPSPEELEKAQRIVVAYEEAQTKGLGVVSLGSKMIDAPVVKRAQRVVRMAKAMGMML